MKRLLLSVLTVAALTTGSAYSASPLSGSAACRGEIFNPINDANWNNMFPVTVAGISMGGGSNPSLMHMDPICLCPGPYGIDMPGIGMTFWEPTFLAEVARTPGCMSTLGGTQVLTGYDSLTMILRWESIVPTQSGLIDARTPCFSACWHVFRTRGTLVI